MSFLPCSFLPFNLATVCRFFTALSILLWVMSQQADSGRPLIVRGNGVKGGVIWRHDQTGPSLLPTPNPDWREVPRDLHPRYTHKSWDHCPDHHRSSTGPLENREIQEKIPKSKMGGIRRATVNGLGVVLPFSFLSHHRIQTQACVCFCKTVPKLDTSSVTCISHLMLHSQCLSRH